MQLEGLTGFVRPPAAPQSSVSSVSASAGAGSSVEAVATQVALAAPAAGGEHRRQCFGDRFFNDEQCRRSSGQKRDICVRWRWGTW